MTGPPPWPQHVLAAAVATAPAAVASIERVEVRKNPEATTWYDARLRDVVLGGRARVSFDGGVWPDREVPCTTVRPRPSPASGSAASGLQPGDVVEIRVAASDRNPCGWALGRALSVQDGGLVHVVLEGSGPGAKALGLRADAIRPASHESTLDPLLLARRAVFVDSPLRAWLTSPDARGCLEQVRSTAGLSLAGAGTDSGGICATGTVDAHATASALAASAAAAGKPAPEVSDVEPDAVIMLGSDASVQKGEMLLRIHMLHQQEIESFNKRRNQKLNLLEKLRDMKVGTGAFRQSFEVEANLVGRTCGRGGERISRAEEEFSVEVRIVDGAEDSAPRTVHIIGESEEAVAQARSELEIVRESYPVDEEKAEWMGAEAQDIARKAGLVHALQVDGGLELCGHRRNIEDAVLLLDSHSDYFSVFQEMERQKDEIERSFQALAKKAEAAGLARPGGAARRGRSAGAPTAARAGAADAEEEGSAVGSSSAASGAAGKGRSGGRRGGRGGRGGGKGRKANEGGS